MVAWYLPGVTAILEWVKAGGQGIGSFASVRPMSIQPKTTISTVNFRFIAVFLLTKKLTGFRGAQRSEIPVQRIVGHLSYPYFLCEKGYSIPSRRPSMILRVGSL
jgi:hypothetical protein